MVTDYLGNEINVGDIMIYGVGRGSIDHGLVIEINENQDTRYNRTLVKFKIARVFENREYIYNHEERRGYYHDLGGWKVKRVTHGNVANCVVVRDLNNVDNEIRILEIFKKEIIEGAKVVGKDD